MKTLSKVRTDYEGAPFASSQLSCQPSSEGYSPAEVEKIVRTKLAEQLETITDIESEIRRLEEDTLAREIAERAERMAEEARTISLRLPKAEVLVKERAVLECYARNKDRPLDCWKEFEGALSLPTLSAMCLTSFRFFPDRIQGYCSESFPGQCFGCVNE